MANKEETNLVLVPYGSYSEPCSAGWLLCSHARPPPGVGAVERGTQFQEHGLAEGQKRPGEGAQKHKMFIYLGHREVTESQQGKRSKLPRKIYVESEWYTFRGK